MNLPLINTFDPPYEKWETREPTTAEVKTPRDALTPIKVKITNLITDAKEAASYMANVGADNGLGNHVNTNIDKNENFKVWKKEMPSQTPKELSKHQISSKSCNLPQVTKKINEVGRPLSEGQCIFHGGVSWSENKKLTLDRPLSTSFCPQVALREAEHQAKAYDAGRIDLLVLKVTNPKTNVFVYKRKGTSMGYENEILFNTGAKLTTKSTTLVRSNYKVAKYGEPSKEIPIYVHEVDIS